MEAKGSPTLRVLTPGDAPVLQAMLGVFADAFEDPQTYTAAPPDSAYHEALLASPTFIAVAALEGDTVVGALTAYELAKFEARRKEIYIYDLAVALSHRRRGIATALIRKLQALATQRGAGVVFVQAHRSDDPAVALYSKLGTREDVLHFDIPPAP